MSETKSRAQFLGNLKFSAGTYSSWGANPWGMLPQSKRLLIDSWCRQLLREHDAAREVAYKNKDSDVLTETLVFDFGAARYLDPSWDGAPISNAREYGRRSARELAIAFRGDVESVDTPYGFSFHIRLYGPVPAVDLVPLFVGERLYTRQFVDVLFATMKYAEATK